MAINSPPMRGDGSETLLKSPACVTLSRPDRGVVVNAPPCITERRVVRRRELRLAVSSRWPRRTRSCSMIARMRSTSTSRQWRNMLRTIGAMNSVWHTAARNLATSSRLCRPPERTNCLSTSCQRGLGAFRGTTAVEVTCRQGTRTPCFPCIDAFYGRTNKLALFLILTQSHLSCSISIKE